MPAYRYPQQEVRRMKNLFCGVLNFCPNLPTRQMDKWGGGGLVEHKEFFIFFFRLILALYNLVKTSRSSCPVFYFSEFE
jgi:hypothetical protein